ncbi:MAG: bifunctional riboflavin kinase/FAD synthetase [Byssovorax sp.]
MAQLPARIVAIGNFDGVHRGHQAVLADAARDARERGLDAALLTFSPHPAVALGRSAPPVLTRLPRKLELFARAAPTVAPLVERFDAAFAAQSPDAFAEEVLARRLGARVVVVGKNFRFGKDRAGDFDTLSRLGASLGFETRSHALLGDERGAWSSTRVREAIRTGDLDEATRMLGRPHMVSGLVVAGDQRGRTIGVPTANLGEVEEALPAHGVYAVLVDREIEGGALALARGVANVGVRPTVTGGEARPNVEVHLFDFDGDLYGARLRVHLIARLRAEQRFSGLDALRAQIAKDAADARAILHDLAPDPEANGAFR